VGGFLLGRKGRRDLEAYGLAAAEDARQVRLRRIRKIYQNLMDEVFPQISARIRRVLQRDPSSGLPVRQVEDCPIGKGLSAIFPLSWNEQ
jgi:hypothetical protein